MCSILVLVLTLFGNVMTIITLDTSTDSLVVRTTSGPVEGFTVETPLGKFVDVFLGIPYGAPTGGENRFSPPKEPTAWQDTFQAKSIPNACTQGSFNDFNYNADRFWESNVPDSEDCLRLNIWIPKTVIQKLPVLVWIHGGGLQTGASAMELYNGAILASEEELIVLNFDYRLTVFGFIYLDHPDAPGNVGLMDQAFALQWVQRNIEHFGGDSNLVTFAGHTGGAASVGFHLLLPSSHGLFKRVIVHSCNPVMLFFKRTKEEVLSYSLEVARFLGCASSDHNKTHAEEILQCLKLKNTSEIQIALKTLDHILMPFVPVMDGIYLPSDPKVLLKQKEMGPETQVMVGSTVDDGSTVAMFFLPDREWSEDSFFTKDEVENITKLVIRSNCDVLARAVRYHYVDWEDPDDPVKMREGIKRFITDVFICAHNLFSDQLSANGNHLYRYSFNHKPSTSPLPQWTGPLHGDDIPFVFGVPLDPSKGFNDQEKKLSRNAMHYWSNFIKNGDPNSGPHELFHWPRYTLQGKESLELQSEPRVLNGESLRQCAFWTLVFPGIRALLRASITS